MKNFCIIWCVLVSSSPLVGMEYLKNLINQGVYTLLVNERDQRIKDNFCNKICGKNLYSHQNACKVLNQLIKEEQTKDLNPENFNQFSIPSPVAMVSGHGDHNPKTLALGNNYNFGGWSAAAAFVAGVGIAYLWFGRNRSVL